MRKRLLMIGLLGGSFLQAEVVYSTIYIKSGLVYTPNPMNDCSTTPFTETQTATATWVTLCHGMQARTGTVTGTGTGYCHGSAWCSNAPSFVARADDTGNLSWNVYVNVTSVSPNASGGCGIPAVTQGPVTTVPRIDCGVIGGGPKTGPPSPIIIDIDGGGYHLTSAREGVMFDFYGDGKPFQISWTAPGSANAFLVRDIYGTGKIINAMEMFGDLTAQPPSNDPNGFLALAQYDKNHDGWIDERDEIYSKLLLWQDVNHNGVTDAGELHTLPELGVWRIYLSYQLDAKKDQFGNLFRYQSAINDASHDRQVYDVILTDLTKAVHTPVTR